MLERQWCAGRMAASWRGQQCDNRIRRRKLKDPRATLPSGSLNLPSRPGCGHFFGTFDRSHGGDSQVVASCPNPDTVFIGAVYTHGNEEIALPGGAYITRSFIWGVDVCDGLTIKQRND